MQSSQDKNDTRGKSMQPQQSAWMAHWKHTNVKPADVAKNQLSIRSESGDENGVAKHSFPISQPAAIETSSSKLQRLRNETVKFDVWRNKDSTRNGMILSALGPSPHGFLKRPHSIRETFDGQSFPMSRVSIGGETSLDPKYGESSSNKSTVVRSKIGSNTGYDALCSITETCSFARPPSVAETQARGPRYQLEDVTWTPEGHSLAVPTPYEVHNAVPYRFNNGRTTMQTVFGRQDSLSQPGATSLVHGMNTNNNAGLLNDSVQANRFVGQQFLNMNSHSDAESFPSFISQYGLSRMPFSPSNLEIMRIRTTIDSVEGSSRGPPKFSQTTHQFFTKQTEGGQTFRETATYTKFKGKAVNEVISFPPDFGFHVKKQGVKLQPLDSSADIGTIRTSALGSGNDSSAETDTMDMGACHENRPSGTTSAPSNKDVSRVGKSPASDAALSSAREKAKDGLLKPELPDINQVLPGLQNAEDTAYDKETSTSRTLSLGVDHFLSHGKQLMDSRSSPKIPSGVDPYRRWVKRLKPNASSDSLVHGTKNSKMEEALSHDKVNKLFGKILERRRTGQEPTAIQPRAREQTMRDQSAGSTRNAESTTVSVRKSQHIARPHFWIQRWCHNLSASSKGKPEELVVCEQPQSLKETPPSKQCPSIAAMALMGRAMNGFRPCTFRKRGSSVVWNTKEDFSRGIDAGK